MFVKFTNEHPIGIAKDRVCQVDEKAGEKFIASGYAEEADEEAFEKWKLEFKAAQISGAKKATRTAEQANLKREKTLPKEDLKGSKNKPQAKTKTPEPHQLTEEDLKEYPGETRGFKVGDLVVLNEDGGMIVGAKGVFVVPGNSGASLENGEANSNVSE